MQVAAQLLKIQAIHEIHLQPVKPQLGIPLKIANLVIVVNPVLERTPVMEGKELNFRKSKFFLKKIELFTDSIIRLSFD